MDQKGAFSNCKAECFDFRQISKYFRNATQAQTHYHVISDKISSDLDLDDVFRYIDRTTSKIGQQYLYYKIRTIDSIERLNHSEQLVNLFEKQGDKSVKIKAELSKLSKGDSYLDELIHGKQIEKPSWFVLTYFLTLASVLSLLFSFINPAFLFVVLLVYIVNFTIHYANKANITYYLMAVAEFYKAIRIIKRIEKDNEIKKHFDGLPFLSRIYKIQNKTRFITFERNLSGNDVFTILWVLFEQVKILFNVEIILFFSFIDDIVRERESINQLFGVLGEIDASISISNLRSELPQMCKPVFVDDKIIDVVEIAHPLVENCVSNSLGLNHKSLLLTGSNMSGKTTFIRAFAINSILAQTIHACFAKSYKAPFFRIYSSIRIADSLFENSSYFLEEVLRIKEFIAESEKSGRCFFVLDEIFKGTNTAERISCGNSILSYLNKKQHLVFVSTHDIELTELLKQENYELYHFKEQVVDNQLIFDHKLRYGKLETRNAIKILELYDYPHEIITMANETLNIVEDKHIAKETLPI